MKVTVYNHLHLPFLLYTFPTRGIKHKPAFSQKRICVHQNQLLYLLRFKNKEFVMVAGSSS